ATYFLEEKKTENPFSILSILNYRQGASNYQKLNDRIVKSVMNFITALNYYDTSNHNLESQILTTDVNLTVEESENAKWQNSEFNLQEEAKKIPEKLIDIVNSFESEERLIFIQTLSALRTYFCDFYNTRQSNTNNINFENNSELSGTIINLNYIQNNFGNNNILFYSLSNLYQGLSILRQSDMNLNSDEVYSTTGNKLKDFYSELLLTDLKGLEELSKEFDHIYKESAKEYMKTLSLLETSKNKFQTRHAKQINKKFSQLKGNELFNLYGQNNSKTKDILFTDASQISDYVAVSSVILNILNDFEVFDRLITSSIRFRVHYDQSKYTSIDIDTNDLSKLFLNNDILKIKQSNLLFQKGVKVLEKFVKEKKLENILGEDEKLNNPREYLNAIKEYNKYNLRLKNQRLNWRDTIFKSLIQMPKNYIKSIFGLAQIPNEILRVLRGKQNLTNGIINSLNKYFNFQMNRAYLQTPEKLLLNTSIHRAIESDKNPLKDHFQNDILSTILNMTLPIYSQINFDIKQTVNQIRSNFSKLIKNPKKESKRILPILYNSFLVKQSITDNNSNIKDQIDSDIERFK
ncbi:hypothetical protein HOK68_04875, partial [Candidatus Woesearchaeota archaeon]|nr:hypothetical protein [Candidatus Woesearchaeota archaeon]